MSIEHMLTKTRKLINPLLLVFAGCGGANYGINTSPNSSDEPASLPTESDNQTQAGHSDILEQYRFRPWRRAFLNIDECEPVYGPFECAFSYGAVDRVALREHCGGDYFRARVVGSEGVSQEAAAQLRLRGEEVFEYAECVIFPAPRVYVFCTEDDFERAGVNQ